MEHDRKNVSFKCWHTLLLILIMNIVNVSYSLVKYAYITDPKTWGQANVFCRNTPNGKLANISDLSVINVSGDIWVDRHRTLTNWIWSTGCYETKTVTLSSKQHDFGQLSSVGRCQDMCDTNFIALGGSKCYCLNTKPEETLSYADCRKRCAGDVTDYCGSENGAAVSIYKIETETFKIDITPKEGATQCAAYGISRNKSLKLYQRNCSEKMKYICKPYKTAGGFSLGLFGKNNNWKNWVDSRTICKSFNGELADTSSSIDVPDGVGEDAMAWIGLFRRDITDLFEGRNNPLKTSRVTNLVRAGSGALSTHLVADKKIKRHQFSPVCGYYSKTEGTVIDQPWTRCLRKLPFVCRIDDVKVSEITRSSPHTPNTTMYSQEESLNETSQEIQKQKIILGAIIGSIVGLLIVIVIIIVILYMISHIKSRKNKNIFQTRSDIPGSTSSDSNINSISTIETPAGNRDSLNGTYTDLNRGQYDVLNKKRAYVQLKSCDPVYSHATNACDGKGMYDHTQHNDSRVTDEETYDHTPGEHYSNTNRRNTQQNHRDDKDIGVYDNEAYVA